MSANRWARSTGLRIYGPLSFALPGRGGPFSRSPYTSTASALLGGRTAGPRRRQDTAAADGHLTQKHRDDASAGPISPPLRERRQGSGRTPCRGGHRRWAYRPKANARTAARVSLDPPMISPLVVMSPKLGDDPLMMTTQAIVSGDAGKFRAAGHFCVEPFGRHQRLEQGTCQSAQSPPLAPVRACARSYGLGRVSCSLVRR
jgi:hypothetical protein